MDKLKYLGSSIKWRDNEVCWYTHGILEAKSCCIRLKYFFKYFERGNVNSRIDIFTILGKRRLGPVTSTDIVHIIHDPEFGMCKSIAFSI